MLDIVRYNGKHIAKLKVKSFNILCFAEKCYRKAAKLGNQNALNKLNNLQLKLKGL